MLIQMEGRAPEPWKPIELPLGLLPSQVERTPHRITHPTHPLPQPPIRYPNLYPNPNPYPNPYPKLAPRWLKIALCWLKLVPRGPTWLPKAPQVPQDETKMAFKMRSTSICFGFLVLFSRFASGPTFSN